MSKKLTPLEALCYLDDIAHGRKMEFDPHDLKEIIENELLDNYYFKYMVAQICDWMGLDIKPFEDLVETKNEIINYIHENECFRVDVATNKNKLKAFEIIKKKRVFIEELLQSDSLDEYNDYVDDQGRYDEDKLTQAEFDLLKEVLR